MNKKTIEEIERKFIINSIRLELDRNKMLRDNYMLNIDTIKSSSWNDLLDSLATEDIAASEHLTYIINEFKKDDANDPNEELLATMGEFLINHKEELYGPQHTVLLLENYLECLYIEDVFND